MTTDWTVAAVGDAIVGTAIAIHDDDSDQRFRAMCDLIRAADIASINLEMSIFERDTFSGWPSAERGGSYLHGSPDLVDDLLQIGFDLFARANNHAGDWGIEGLRATTVELDARRVGHAGVGMNLAEGSRPVYFDTPKGRVAMISLTTTFPVSSKAAMQRPDIAGRPGCNGVRIRRRLILPDPTFSVVQNALDDAGDPSLLSKLTIELEPGDKAEVVETLDQGDVDRVLSEIDQASAFSDVVLVNGHTHEPRNEVTDVPRWLEVFARQCIDVGAHAYLGHGPHQLRGIEIYRRRPIFYSLGNFIFHREAADPIPAEQYDLFDLDPLTAVPQDYLRARDGSDSELSMTSDVFYEAVIPIMTFRSGCLQSLAIHPIELSSDAPLGSRGTPRLAPVDLAESILTRLAAISSPYGFEFSVSKGVAQWLADN